MTINNKLALILIIITSVLHHLPCEAEVPGVHADDQGSPHAEPDLLQLPKASVTILSYKVCEDTIFVQYVRSDLIFWVTQYLNKSVRVLTAVSVYYAIL